MAGIDPNDEWLGHVQPVGLVVAPIVLARYGLVPAIQTRANTEAVRAFIAPNPEVDRAKAADSGALKDPWAFFHRILGWSAGKVAGAPGGLALPEDLILNVEESDTEIAPHWAVADSEGGWQILVRIEAPGVRSDERGALAGWEATPHQRFERLLREKKIPIGLLITDYDLRLVYAPSGETSGWLTLPLRSLIEVGGRPMLGGLKLLLSSFQLHNDAPNRRLPALLRASREAQAEVSTRLAGQALGALHELLRGLHAADRQRIEALAASAPEHLYDGLLTVLLRLVFLLYAEDRDLIPSRTDPEARAFYAQGYGVRSLYGRLLDDKAHHPDTIDERRGAWGQLLALFALLHHGDSTGDWVRGRGGRLFDPETFPFLQGQDRPDDRPAPAAVSDGCILRILDLLITVDGEKLSYRTLDVEQIGSVYETVMGFTIETRAGPAVAIKAGKNDRTPIFVDLVALAEIKGSDRAKFLKEKAARHALTDRVARVLSAAAGQSGVLEALRPIVDERGSPGGHISPADTPLLQPTDERRRTGSHYTPRSLTAPIVEHALEPAFERLGPDARPEEVLALKVCDPAMGSGAFLVEACRAIGDRLVLAWARWPETRPKIPDDEDEPLHARRLVAQRCLYGVDKNPRAVELAKLSLWLATLARDHEFTFLDHALKCGDSLVGLDATQIAAMHWNESKPGLPLFRRFVANIVGEALRRRREIQEAPDDTTRTIQEGRFRKLDDSVQPARILGDATLATFFTESKPLGRERRRQEVESLVSGSLNDAAWAKLRAIAGTLREGEHPIPLFHWRLEFPEVFARDNAGFDAIVGNPPFAGKNTIIAGHRAHYLPWLQTLHSGAHGNADLVAHFFRRAFGLLRQGGVLGLIATNTIGQGDTRASGLTSIIANGGVIMRARPRLKWPGEAAVVVSVVHVAKGNVVSPVLDDRPVRRISAYLVEGDLDTSPQALAANSGKAFQGSIVLGMGFTFDDVAAAKGKAESLEKMRAVIATDPRNAERVFPYLGGEEINNSPTHAHHQDGPRHVWVEGLPAMDLIVTMDDATSEVYSMLLVAEEGTASTFEALREVIGERGLFCALYTDRGSHYFHTPEAGGKVSSTVQTQVGRALAHLGIEHIAAYSPQARGPSERLFATFQDRLPKELRLAGIPSVEAANAWLKSHYITEHNARFAVDPEQEGSAFVPDEKEMWREILCSVEERTVANDNTVAWKGKRLQLPESRLRPHFVKAQVRVHEYPDGACAVFLGPHRLADYDAEGAALRVPTAMKPGAVLGALKDKPCRARLRASLTAPARDASSAAQAGTRKRPPGRTRKQPHPSPAIGAPRPMKMGTIASPCSILLDCCPGRT